MKRLIVLTGGPAVGKTTLIARLAELGYPTIRESARDIIEQQKQIGSDKVPWGDRRGFQRLVMDEQLRREAEAEGEVIFLDRGLPDGIAYLEEGGFDPMPELSELSHNRYDQVLLLEPLASYNKDAVRYEDERVAETMQLLIAEAYGGLGYEMIPIPALPADDRVAAVLDATASS